MKYEATMRSLVNMLTSSTLGWQALVLFDCIREAGLLPNISVRTTCLSLIRCPKNCIWSWPRARTDRSKCNTTVGNCSTDCGYVLYITSLNTSRLSGVCASWNYTWISLNQEIHLFKRFKTLRDFIEDIKCSKWRIYTHKCPRANGSLFVLITDCMKDSQLGHAYHDVLGLELTNFRDWLKCGIRSKAPGQMDVKRH